MAGIYFTSFSPSFSVGIVRHMTMRRSEKKGSVSQAEISSSAEALSRICKFSSRVTSSRVSFRAFRALSFMNSSSPRIRYAPARELFFMFLKNVI